MFSNPKVYPGDTIVANSKPEKDENDNSQKLRDTAILGDKKLFNLLNSNVRF